MVVCTPRARLGSALLLASSLSLACTGEETPDAGPADSGVADDAGETPDTGVDAGPPDSGVRTVCDDLGLPGLAMQAGDGTYDWGDVAGDFTVNTMDGPWTLSEQWTGCESYVFVNYIGTTSDYQDRFFSSSVTGLLFDTPLNAHYFFMSWESDAAAREARVKPLRDRILANIFDRYPDDATRLAQFRRFHFVTDRALDVAGSVGALLTDYMAYQRNPASRVDLGDRGMAPPPLPWMFAIDRDQRWDFGGSVDEFVGGDPKLKMASYLPGFFDHKARIRDAQAAETGVQTEILLDAPTSNRTFVRSAQLPSPSAMAAMDTLEFDVTVNCPHRNVFACSEWDRIADIELCLDGEACADRRELVRWITPYWRVGMRRWVMDASDLLGFVRQGGLRWFQITMGPEWERATLRDVRVALRLASKGNGTRTSSVVEAFTGGDFNATYNDRTPVTFTPPADATKVELVVILSGHGQEAGNNCAEWCDHRHQFAVNGAALPEIRYEGSVGSSGGCAPTTAQGLPPGQFGNWAPERAYWCPGLPVDHIRVDITDKVNLGQANTLEYSGNFEGGPPAGGNISLTSYVVWAQ
ncbi:MAG: hypothetical protein KC933_27125 [Myxococcales bacterium]|nr:hypothetical protein [Myxococcales bacterium]